MNVIYASDDNYAWLMGISIVSLFENNRESHEINVWLFGDGTTPGYYYTFAKAVDNRTIAQHDDTLVESGLWVDIFPWDAVPNTKIRCAIYLKACHWLRNWILAMSCNFNYMKVSKKYFEKLLLAILSHLIGKRNLYNFAEKLSRKFCNTDFIACLTTPYTEKERFFKKDMKPVIKMEFEGHFFNAPQNWNLFLSTIYGDYASLPPKEKRKTHNIVAWEK